MLSKEEQLHLEFVRLRITSKFVRKIFRICEEIFRICEKNFRLFTNPYEFLKYKMLTLLKLGAPSVLGAPSASLSMPSKASVIATRVSTAGAILSDLRLH